MSLKIRLARGGAKKRPHYSIVVADSRYPRDGRFIEKIGTFNPMLAKDNAERVKLDAEKAKEWLAKGAQPTDRVERFLDAMGLLKRKARNNPEKAQPKKKAVERAAAVEAAHVVDDSLIAMDESAVERFVALFFAAGPLGEGGLGHPEPVGPERPGVAIRHVHILYTLRSDGVIRL